MLLTPLPFSCSDDDTCFEKWEYSEYCTRTSDCPVVGCGETPQTSIRNFKCEEVDGISPGETVLIDDQGCAKFYRTYIKKVE